MSSEWLDFKCSTGGRSVRLLCKYSWVDCNKRQTLRRLVSRVTVDCNVHMWKYLCPKEMKTKTSKQGQGGDMSHHTCTAQERVSDLFTCRHTLSISVTVCFSPRPSGTEDTRITNTDKVLISPPNIQHWKWHSQAARHEVNRLNMIIWKISFHFCSFRQRRLCWPELPPPETPASWRFCNVRNDRITEFDLVARQHEPRLQPHKPWD